MWELEYFLCWKRRGEGAVENPTEAQRRVRSTLHYLGNTTERAERYRDFPTEDHDSCGMRLFRILVCGSLVASLGGGCLDGNGIRKGDERNRKVHPPRAHLILGLDAWSYGLVKLSLVFNLAIGEFTKNF
jgi:hypothetical protein